jgi:hypothetical protein
MSTMDSPHIHERERHVGLLGYYWFLTFEQAPEFHSLTKECQQAIGSTYFAPTPVDGLHLTLDRIAYYGESTPAQRDLITTAALHTCQELSPFSMTMERLGNLGGAIGFNVMPTEHVHNLRDTLRAATLSIVPDAPVKTAASDPHVTIAYPVLDGRSTMAAATADTINATIRGVDVTVTEAAMVLLERREHSYEWDVVTRIPLAGCS